jgi:hypothetical protein
MKWEKNGHIFSVSGEGGWMNTHAQLPTPLIKKDEGVLRVYFSTRSKQSESGTSFVDLDLDNIRRVIRVNENPILPLGSPGMFDEHGVMPACAIQEGENVFLYYSGWQRSTGVLYNNYAGLAISEDGGETFRRAFNGPVFDRTTYEVYSATSPLILKDNDLWHAWYSAGTNWHTIDGKLEHTYDLKHATSLDGRQWRQNNETAVAQKDEYEALTMPAVKKIGDEFHMWFSYRGSAGFRGVGDSAYRIGYANSRDLITWARDDLSAGIDLSETGWDSEMIAYPAICDVNGDTIMLYNGNGFGVSGFGFATLVEI